MALFVSNVDNAHAFYKGFLGYEEPFDLKNSDGSLALTFIKVNDRQYVELFPEREPNSDRLHHISIEVDDAEAMRRYLAARGVKVPEKTPRGRIGNLNFTIPDPDGHGVEIVQYAPDGWSVRERGKFLGPRRVSLRMLHAGILVGSVEASLRFYRDLLGFEETWRGSRNGQVLDWINLRVPDGTDYVELMLYKELPAPARRGVQHHICLEVPDIEKAMAHLKDRTGYGKPLEPRTGVNRRRQMNLFDPDGTRIELMEPHTVDGKPTSSSTAPPPIP